MQSRRRHAWTAAVALSVAALTVPVAWLARADVETAHVVAVPTSHVRVISLDVAGRERSYRLFSPPHLGARPHTLLVALHWLNGSAARFEAMSGLDRLAGLNDAVVAYPDGVGHSWDAGGCCGVAVQEHLDDVQFILAVVADVERRVPIDPARVAVTGFSNGGLMSYRLACQRPDVFRAAVAVAGDVVVPRCTPARAVSLLHVHGLLDRVIPIAGTSDSSLDAEGFPPAIASVQRIATADRCRGSGTTRSTRTLTWWTATSCASGAAVQFVTVDAMTHHYPTGGKASRAYGVDMARLTWAFLRGAWPE